MENESEFGIKKNIYNQRGPPSFSYLNGTLKILREYCAFDLTESVIEMESM